MKKVKLLFIVIAACFMAACSGSLERQAKSRYKEFPKGLEKKMASVDVKDEKVIFSEDSICIIQYTIDTENYSGEKNSARMEYILWWFPDDEPKLMEATHELDGENSSILDNEVVWYDKVMRKEIPEDKQERSRNLRIISIALAPLQVQVVED